MADDDWDDWGDGDDAGAPSADSVKNTLHQEGEAQEWDWPVHDGE